MDHSELVELVKQVLDAEQKGEAVLDAIEDRCIILNRTRYDLDGIVTDNPLYIEISIARRHFREVPPW